MTNIVIVSGFIIAIGMSGLLLFLRMKKWLSRPIKNTLAIGLTVIGIIGFIMSNSNDFRFLFYSILVPPIYLMIDKLLTRISFKYKGRDFYLFLRFSNDIDDHKYEINFIDEVISFSMLGLILGLTIFGAVLFGKADLFNRWFIN